jgi:hypothetical protein
MKQTSPSSQIQFLSQSQIRVYFPQFQYFGRMNVTSSSDFIGNVFDFEYIRIRSGIGDKGAHSRLPDNVTVFRQFPQGTMSGHSGYSERLDQVILGRHSIARIQIARVDHFYNVVLNLAIHCLGRINWYILILHPWSLRVA